MEDYKQIFDGAEAVKVEYNGPENPIIVVWHGGTTFNVYSTGPFDDELSEIDVFNLSDKDGCAPDRQTAVNHMKDWLDRELNQ